MAPMLRVILKDTSGEIFLEDDFSENLSVKMIKSRLIRKLTESETEYKNIILKNMQDDHLGIERINIFYGKDNVSDELLISSLSKKKIVYLTFNIVHIPSEGLDSLLCEGLKGCTPLELDNSSLDIYEKNKKVRVLVDANNIIKKNGKYYLVVSREKRSRLFDQIKSFVSSIQKDMLLKISFIMVLILIKNISIAIVLTLILLLRTVGCKKINIRRDFKNICMKKAVLKILFLFFYTMFVISADENILNT